MSFGRSDSLDTVSGETIKKASDVYFKNMEEIMKIQEQRGYDEVSPKAVMSMSEACPDISRDNIGQTVSDISEHGIPCNICRKNYQGAAKKVCHYRGRIWTMCCRLAGRT